jgi:hypothetical protein
MLSTFTSFSVNSPKHLKFMSTLLDSSVAEFILSKAEGLLQNDTWSIFETVSSIILLLFPTSTKCSVELHESQEFIELGLC